MLSKCRRCRSKQGEIHIPYANMILCPDCFIDFYVKRIKKTVKKYRMFRKGETVGVAVSGGKDSSALLHALRNAFPSQKIVALHLNLGIKGYSDHCQKIVEGLAGDLDVDLHIFDLQKEEGIGIGDFERTVFKGKMCAACGTIKRHALEELARNVGAKVLATGHHMDDVLGFMFSNLFSKQWMQLVRLRPVLPPLASWMTRKVKPLFRTPENENLLYCFYADVSFRRESCPYSEGTKTKENLKIIEILSGGNPSFRHQSLNAFLELSEMLEKVVKVPRGVPCRKCGFPSLDGLCAYCKRLNQVKGNMKAREKVAVSSSIGSLDPAA